MSQIAVTGAAGPVGRRVVARLLADPEVERVVGVDREPIRPVDDDDDFDGRLELHRLHLLGTDLVPLFRGLDAVIHLAGSDPLEGTEPGHDLHTVTRILDAVDATGVGQLVVRTTAAVYGAWPDNPVPMAETVTRRPNQECDWVRVRAELEDRVSDFAGAHPHIAVAVLRPCITVSPQGPDELGRVLAAARLVARADSAAPAQFVHADDVAAAVEVVWRDGATGAFNIAPDGALDADLIRALVGGAPRIPLPESVARRLTSIGWRYQLAPTPPGFVPFVNHPWVVASDRLRALGWEPTHTNEEAYVAGHDAAPWAQVSPQRRQELALGVAAAALITGIGGAAALMRRKLRP